MTEQEIKDYIVNLCKDSECRYLTEDNECIEAGICFEVKETCVKALNKQIAKKVLIKHHEKTPWTREIWQYLCPCCNSVIGFNGQIYCSTCGQKLLYDWGNEDAE